MAHLGESRRWRGAVALPQPVIFGIADAWRVFLVVAPVMGGDLSFQPRMLRLGLCGGELTHRNFGSVSFGGVLGCHSGDNPSFRVRPRRLPGIDSHACRYCVLPRGADQALGSSAGLGG